MTSKVPTLFRPMVHWLMRSGPLLPLIAAWWGQPLAAAALEIRQCTDLETLIKNITNFAGAILTAVAVLIFIIAAYYFLFGAGSEDAAKKGRQYLTFGVVGIIVAIVAFTLPGLIESATGLQTKTCATRSIR